MNKELIKAAAGTLLKGASKANAVVGVVLTVAEVAGVVVAVVNSAKQDKA